MIDMKKQLLFFPLVFTCLLAAGQTDMKLWYDHPAEYFEQTLVMGNGRMGASIFGGVASDTLYLNDATLWSGEPVKPGVNPEAHTYVPLIREALNREDYKTADKLSRKMQGAFSQSYLPLGTLVLDFQHKGTPTEYYRELDISQALTRVNYQVDGVSYSREYFVSHPAQVMAVKLSADKAGMLSFDLGFISKLNYTASSKGDGLDANGYAPYHTEPLYMKGAKEPIRYDENRGTRFAARCKIENKGGSVTAENGVLKVRGAKQAVIYVSVSTSFNGFDKDPCKEGLDEKMIAHGQLIRSAGKGYDVLKEEHLKDYTSLYNRFAIDLGTAENIPTDQRLERYASGAQDKYLEALYVQFGRYLLISSSRTPGVPANLQGIWNPHLRPPWSSNYTANINVEENYWLAESTNLSEMHEPLLGFIKNLSKTGVATARDFLGVGGWASCHNTDIWALSNPVGGFGSGGPYWANWYFGGVWLSTHLWERYDYTRDNEYLSSVWPVMKGAVQFCLEWMVEDKHGRLITSPSTSPECRYTTPEGYKGGVLYGATCDLAMIRELFAQAIKTCDILDMDQPLKKEMERALERLHPYTIGAKGHLVEWYHDWDNVRNRHTTHLFGLHPGTHITPDKTPELAQACRRALELRGERATGWAMGWRINLWARLFDGNQAYKMLRWLLNPVKAEGKVHSTTMVGGTYPNLLDAHPPFQIDGNFGAAAGVVQMLVQSSENEIRILPALPDAWDKGSIRGARTRGGFEVSFDWSEHKLRTLTISSEVGGKTTVISGSQTQKVNLEKGGSVTLDWL